MKSNKNMFILLVAILLVVVLLASTSALVMSGIGETPTKVSVVIDDSSSGRWSSFLAGMEQAAKDTGVKVNVVSTSKNMTVKQQSEIINDEISAGADGVILQVTSSQGTAEMISDISRKAVLLLVDTSAEMDVDVEGRSACIQVDNVELGRALANEVRIALGNDLRGQSIGIIAGNQKQYSIEERLQGFNENIESSGAKILWTDNSIINVSDKIALRQENARADVLVALDNTTLEAACEYALKQEDPPYIFGEGTSIKVVSYVDDGIITSMVVPNEYYMGYQSITAVARRVENKLTPMENETISFRVVNRENLFDENNQRMLFPVIQ